MADSLTPIVEPVLPQGEEFYDALMAQIEPELVTSQLPLVEARYAGESPEEQQARQARYEAAFAEFDRRAAEEIATLDREVHDYRTASQKEAEQMSRQQESADILTLESSILAA